MRLAACTSAFLVLVLGATAAHAQDAPDVRPPVVDTRFDAPPTPEVAAQIARLEHQLHTAQGRAAAFGALTLGGTALIAGGVLAMVLVAVIDPPMCMGDGCVKPIEDFAPGISLTAVGAIAVIIGGFLWGDADAEARTVSRQIEDLMHPVPTFSLSPDGARIGLRFRF
jgi:hypothetical protein